MNKKAFTLIELLVVVLIIGILAAVALPQYRLAVLRARATKLFVAMHTLEQAQQSYYLANGTFTTDLDDLGVDFPPISQKDCGWNNNSTKTVLHCHVYDSSVNITFESNLSSANGSVVERSCQSLVSNELGNKLCTTYGAFRFNVGSINYYWRDR